MKYILALDQGTSSSRAILYGHDGAIHGVAQREFEQIYPKPGWVEHDPGEIWTSQIGVAVEALSRAKARPRDLEAIGITDQRETTIVWERSNGNPIYNAIVWQDRRTADLCSKLREQNLEGKFRSKTGLLIDPYFSATKIAWMLDHVEGARQKAEAGELAFGTVDSWLLWNLTSGRQHLIEITNASRTLLFNIHDRRWDDELLEILKIPKSMLPEVRSSSEDYGKVSTSLGLGDVKIAGIAGDQQAALFGQACFKPGMAKCTYGTGAFLLQNIGSDATESKNRLLTTVAWQLGDKVQYAMEGSIFVAGSVVQWLRDGLHIIRSSEDVEGLALSEKDSGDVYLVPAFTGLGAPHWDAHARGTLIGITRGTTAGHIARAAIESMAFQVADLLDALKNDTGLALKQLRVDGGASRDDTMLQFQADLLGLPVIRPAITETTSQGAAYLAGLAVGFWDSQDEIQKHWKVDREFMPKRSQDEMQGLRKRWTEAVSRSRDWASSAA